jgi:hypothetical protein
MPDRVLLTEKREKVLKGDYDGSDSALRNQKSRLRRSADTALGELTQIARSPHIDQWEAFDPEDVSTFLELLLTPTAPEHTTTGGLVTDPASEHESDAPMAEVTDEFQHYRDELLKEMGRQVIEDADND